MYMHIYVSLYIYIHSHWWFIQNYMRNVKIQIENARTQTTIKKKCMYNNMHCYVNEYEIEDVEIFLMIEYDVCRW